MNNVLPGAVRASTTWTVDEAATTTGSGTRAASTQHSEIIACAHTDNTVDDIRDGGRGSARQRWELAIER